MKSDIPAAGRNVAMAGSVLVCGTGSIGLRHLRVLRDRLQLDPIALPTRPSRIKELQAEGFRTVDTWRGAADLRPALAIIASDTARHLADASEALKLGADVLIEKPIAPSIKGLQSLATLAAGTKRSVFVACNLRFEAGLQLFREHLPEIGHVHAVRIECQSFLPDWRPGTDYKRAYCARIDEGGVLRDLIHEIDYATWLFGVPDALFGRLMNSGVLGIESDEAADLLWQLPSGASISIRLDYVTRISRRRMRAFGNLGDLEWDYVNKAVTMSLAAQPQRTWTIAQGRDDMMRDQANAFVHFAGGKDSSPLATLEQGASAVSICDTARKSSESGRIEPVLNWRQP